jgi:ABC-type amino acid transport substrate-binding protein
MKKRHLISAIAMFLALMMLGLSCGALADSKNGGTLSYLNMTEEEDEAVSESVRVPILKILFLNGVFVPENDQGQNDSPRVVHFYDTLDTMLMALQSGELDSIKVPYYTARYLCSTNDGLKMSLEYHPEKATGISELAISTLSDGYSFMMKEENAALRDEIDAQITAMKEDGTLQKLIDEHITKVSESGQPVAIAFEKFEGVPIRIAVTGSLPPMDYVAADGTFAGFNTAVLAEIGKRLQKNIELVQVDSIGRALALSEGTVDVVFWTRGPSDSLAGLIREKGEISNEDREVLRAERRETMTNEEKAILDEGETPDQETIAKLRVRDMPAGTIITQPYFTDFQVQVTLK